MTGPQDPAAAGGDRLRAGHADREQVIEVLKVAFVQGRLTRHELGTRVGQALAARTYADLAALTVDIPPAPARPTIPARRRPLGRAAVKSGSCLVITLAYMVFGRTVLDPNGRGPNPHDSWVPLTIALALVAVVAAVGFLADGVALSYEQRRARKQLPPGQGQAATPATANAAAKPATIGFPLRHRAGGIG